MEKSIIKLLIIIILILCFIIYLLYSVRDENKLIKTDTGRIYKNILELKKQ